MGHDTTVEIKSGDTLRDRDEVVMVVESPRMTSCSIRNEKVKVTVGGETVLVYAKDLIEATEKTRA